MWGACPTVFDASQAPDGKHTAFMWEKLPYRLHGDPANWDSAGAAHGRDMLDLWRSHAPNLARRRDRFLHAHAARHRAQPAEHARGRSSGRRVHQRTDRLRPAVSRRGKLSRASAGTLSMRIEQPSRAAMSPACRATTPRRSFSPTWDSRPTGRQPTSLPAWLDSRALHEVLCGFAAKRPPAGAGVASADGLSPISGITGSSDLGDIDRQVCHKRRTHLWRMT